MTINMLRAISKMLDLKESDEVLVAKERVKCAKTMLDEIISGLTLKEQFPLNKEPTATEVVALQPNKSEPTKTPEPTKPKPKPVPKDKRQIVLNDSKKIVRIDNFPLDGKINLDGKIMTHKEAIGKTFTNGRFVE